VSAATAERPTPRASSPGARSGRGVREAPWLPSAVLAIVMAGCFVLLMWAGRDLTIAFDEWSYLLDRQRWRPSALLAPHADHLHLVPALVYKVLFETVGLHDHWPYRLVLVALNVCTGVLLYVYARARVGAWPAVALAVCLVAMSASWYTLVFAFQMSHVAACAAGVGALLALDRASRRGDALACALLGVAAACSTVGVVFLAGALVEVRRRRAWIAVVPLALYALWRLRYAVDAGVAAGNVDAIPGFVLDGFDDAAAAIAGTSVGFGVVVASLLVALVVRQLVDPARTTPRLAGLIVMPLALWTLLALGRADLGVQADENRYLYASGLMLALLGVEAARGHRLSPRAVAAVTVLLGFGALSNVLGVAGAGDKFRDNATGAKQMATALDLAGHLNAAGFAVEMQGRRVEARRYLAATAKYGSTPGYTLDELPGAPLEAQMRVDQALLQVHQARVEVTPAAPAPGATAPAVDREDGGTATADGGCLRFEPAAGEGALEVTLPPAGLVVRDGEGEVQASLRRFAAEYGPDPYGRVPGGAAAQIALAADKAPQPWHARLASGAPFTVCAAA
jgi:hypothetical protein